VENKTRESNFSDSDGSAAFHWKSEGKGARNEDELNFLERGESRERHLTKDLTEMRSVAFHSTKIDQKQNREEKELQGSEREKRLGKRREKSAKCLYSCGRKSPYLGEKSNLAGRKKGLLGIIRI